MTPARAALSAVRDTASDALSSIAARPGRTVLTVGGTVLGIASLVVTSGVAASASANVLRGFDQYRATEVVLRDSRAGSDPVAPESIAALRHLPGVTHAGLWCDLSSISPHLS